MFHQKDVYDKWRYKGNVIFILIYRPLLLHYGYVYTYIRDMKCQYSSYKHVEQYKHEYNPLRIYIYSIPSLVQYTKPAGLKREKNTQNL